MNTKSDLLKRVDAEIADGRHWRAKEILRGNIAAGRVEPEVLEAYGRLLARLGERVEAGKYLFLSGARAAGDDDAIAMFRKRIAKRQGADLVAQLPAAIRRQPFQQLAPIVQRELLELGVNPKIFGPRITGASRATSWGDRLAIAGLLAALGVLVIAVVLGLRSIASWLWRWIG